MMPEATEAEGSPYGSPTQEMLEKAYKLAPDKVAWARHAAGIIFHMLGRDDGINGTNFALKVLDHALETAEYSERVCFEARINRDRP